MRATQWLILTPGGYLIQRFYGTKAQAEAWASGHYSAYKIERDDNRSFEPLFKKTY